MAAPDIELPEPGGQMSFLEHLDELRRRIVYCVVFVVIVFFGCWFVSDYIYGFLSKPIRRALSEAARRDIPITTQSGDQKVKPVTQIEAGETGRYTFDKSTKVSVTVVPAGASVMVKAETNPDGKLALFTTEPLITNDAMIPAGVQVMDLGNPTDPEDERLIVTTAMEPFMILITVSLYTAIALSVPFLLWQIWQFISPALYEHEKSYVTPFIALSTVSFVVGVAFAYYILFPPAARYLLGLGSDFQLLLRASDYLDLITIIMLAMGVIFQMPAITYVLARIGLVSAGLLVRSWKISLVVILIVAAVVSPTNDIPNMLLFAAPMIVLYIISIFVAWLFGKKRQTDAEAAS